MIKEMKNQYHSKKSPIHNIVFDLGGVLLEWNIDKIVTRFSDSSELGEAIKKAVFLHPDWLELDRGTLKEEEAILSFANRSGQSIEEIKHLMAIARESLVPMPESMNLLEDLRRKGYSLYCLSNMHEKSWELIQRRFDFRDKFKGIVISCTLKMVKPEPQIFEYLLSTYCLEPRHTIFIDDHERNILAAQKFGIHGIFFTSAEECRTKIEEIIHESF